MGRWLSQQLQTLCTTRSLSTPSANVYNITVCSTDTSIMFSGCKEIISYTPSSPLFESLDVVVASALTHAYY